MGSDKNIFHFYGQTRWPRLRKSFAIWDHAMKVTKKASRIPLIGKHITWFWDEDHFNQTMIPVNQELAESGSTILPIMVVEEMVRKSCHTVKLSCCLCRTACGCKEYPMSIGCLFLGESTRNIHPSMGTVVSVEEALDHAHHAAGLGLVMHIGKVDPDPYFLGLKDKFHFLTLCFCCQCCCVAMKDFDYFSPAVQARTHRLEGLEVKVSEDCNGCMKCVQKCYTGSIVVEDRKVRVTDGCKGCGLCIPVCPQGALSMTIADGNRMLEEALTRIQRYSDVG